MKKIRLTSVHCITVATIVTLMSPLSASAGDPALTNKIIDVFIAYKSIYKETISDEILSCMKGPITDNQGETFTKLTSPIQVEWPKFLAWAKGATLVNGNLSPNDIIGDGMLYIAGINQIAVDCGLPYK